MQLRRIDQQAHLCIGQSRISQQACIFLFTRVCAWGMHALDEPSHLFAAPMPLCSKEATPW